MEKLSTTKICYKCKKEIKKKMGVYYVKAYEATFHPDCYNAYEHYYGLDKPID